LDLAFMGTPPFAATVLAALIGAGHHVLAVYTRPPRPAGRGHRLQPSAVQHLAEEHGLAVRCPARLRSDQVQAEFAALVADAAVVAAYGLILPAPILAAPRLGCLNVHASLLPRWRGAAPIQHALLAGDRETGITIMQMEEGLDTGPILLQEALPIGPATTAGTLTEALARRGGELMVTALAAAAQGRLRARPQPREGATYAPKISREDSRLDWRRPASELERRVRALDPRPGASFEYRGETIRVLDAAVLGGEPAAAPGTVLDEGLSVACGPIACGPIACGPSAGGSSVLRLLRLQRPGRGPLDAAAFLRGFPIPAATLLPCPATN
jgi:methionyl-tRNA formyltransferase